MKKIVCLCLTALLAVAVLSGCGGKEESNTLTGTLDEVKDFMFVVTDDQDAAYVFNIDSAAKPKGLEDVAVGDRVTVTYTGELSEVDAFTGEVLSVEKAVS